MNDLISRKALLGEITRQRMVSKTSFPKKSFVVGDVIRCINTAPAVEAEPVKYGRWIPLEYDGFADGNPVWDLWGCSECGGEHSGDEDTLTPYCPNCGANMDGGNEDGK